MNRIIIFTGKGGVGKSSVAAAHALASSKSSKKTLLVSADAAHNLGDIFQIDIGSRVKKISEYLCFRIRFRCYKNWIFPKS